MFTGIIEELGTIQSISMRGGSGDLAVIAHRVLEGLKLGDSIAVNGVCLTVASFTDREFVANVMPETLRKSNLNMLKTGERVNLERALALGSRLGGHLVSGHVDGMGRIIEKRAEGNAILFRFATTPEVLRYIIPKGSVAVDGISLTVADAGPDGFSVSIIPHTASLTTLGRKQKGAVVNLENDMVGKYVEHLLSFAPKAKPGKGFSLEVLKDNGFVQ